MRWPTRVLCLAGTAATLLLAGGPAGAYATAAGAIATLSAQGIMAGGPQYPGRLPMSPVDLGYVLERFDARTGHRGVIPAAPRFATRVTRGRGVVDILLAAGLSRTVSPARARRIANRLGLLQGVAGMGAAHATLTRAEVAVMLVNLEHRWNIRPRPLGTIGILHAQGVMAASSQLPGGTPVSPADLASILARFDAHTGHRGTPPATLGGTRPVSRNQGLVATLRATGLSHTASVARDRRIANRIGLFAGIAGMDRGGAPLTRSELGGMLVNLEHYWHMGP